MALIISAEGERRRSGSFDSESLTNKRRAILGGVGFGNTVDSEIKLRFASNRRLDNLLQPDEDTSTNIHPVIAQPSAMFPAKPKPPPVAPKPSKGFLQQSTALQSSLPVKVEKKGLAMPNISLPKTQPVPVVSAVPIKTQATPEVELSSSPLTHPTKARPRPVRKSGNSAAAAAKNNDENIEMATQKLISLEPAVEQKAVPVYAAKSEEKHQTSIIISTDKRNARYIESAVLVARPPSPLYGNMSNLQPLQTTAPKSEPLPVIPQFKGEVITKPPTYPGDSTHQSAKTSSNSSNESQSQNQAAVLQKVTSLSDKCKQLEQEMKDLRRQNQQQIFKLEGHIIELRQQLAIAVDQIRKLAADLNEERKLRLTSHMSSQSSSGSDQFETDV